MVLSSSLENTVMFYGRPISPIICINPFKIAHNLTKNEKKFFILYENKLFFFTSIYFANHVMVLCHLK